MPDKDNDSDHASFLRRRNKRNAQQRQSQVIYV